MRELRLGGLFFCLVWTASRKSVEDRIEDILANGVNLRYGDEAVFLVTDKDDLLAPPSADSEHG